MNKPIVSVIIPTYKRPILLETAIASVLAQSYEDWELIVVDDNDASTPYRQETEAYMGRYANNPNIRHVKHDRNKGLPAARNTGIVHATGELVAFLDDDDQWLPEKLEAQVALFASADDKLALVYTGVKIIDGEGNLMRTTAPTFRGFNPLAFFMRDYNITTPSSVMCRREALLTVGLFDESFLAIEDLDLYIRLAQGHAFDYVPDLLTLYTKHDGEQIMKNADRLADAYDRLYHKHRLKLVRHRKHHASFLFHQGQMLRRAGGLCQAEKKFFQSLRINPFDKTSLRSWLMLKLMPQRYDALRRIVDPLRSLSRRHEHG